MARYLVRLTCRRLGRLASLGYKPLKLGFQIAQPVIEPGDLLAQVARIGSRHYNCRYRQDDDREKQKDQYGAEKVHARRLAEL